MTSYRPFRFGLFCGQGADSRQAWADKARAVEAAGFSTLLLGDHLPFSLSPIAGLMAAANATTTLRVGTAVFGNDFRHPVFLAREAATLDRLSDGRFEFGLGTGWYHLDYEQSGMPLDAPGIRVSRLEEAVKVIKGFFGEQPFDFDGAYYKTRGLKGVPRPVQKPYPPLVIGGGSRRVLNLAGREGDIVSINAKTTPAGWLDFDSMSADRTAEKVGWVREAAGARFDAIELNMLANELIVTNDRRGATRESLTRRKLPADEASVDRWLDSPPIFIGSVNEIVDLMQMRRERYGISYISMFEPMEPLMPVVKRLAGQ